MTQDDYRCYHRPCVRSKRHLRELLAAVKRVEVQLAATGLSDEQLAIVDQLRAARFLVSRFSKLEEST